MSKEIDDIYAQLQDATERKIAREAAADMVVFMDKRIIDLCDKLDGPKTWQRWAAIQAAAVALTAQSVMEVDAIAAKEKQA